MIQPLKSSRTTWLVYWVDLDEPVPSGTDFFLPTLLVVTDVSGVPLAPPTVLEELNQIRVEGLLVRLFDSVGPPDRISICASEDWDEEAWRGFSEEHGVEIRFSRMDSAGPDDLRALAHSVLVRYVTKPESPPPSAQDVAQGLLRTAHRVSSSSKKEALLKIAVQRDPACSAARIELADNDFHKGNWRACLAAYEEILTQDGKHLQGASPHWWTDHTTRPYLRALYGKAMTLWHRGKYAPAATDLEYLLSLNPKDNQGVRFFIPMLHLLAEDLELASSSFDRYHKAYPKDYPEPAMVFGWGLCLSLQGEESAARAKYREGILRNHYIVPMLLEEPLPPRSIWLPNDRADPSYASEFIDSYAVLWDRESGALRILREVWTEMTAPLKALLEHRTLMLDFQDQRYEPDFKSLWQKLLDEDDRLTHLDSPD